MLYREFATQEQLDAEYDVESIHPDFAAVAGRLQARSQGALAYPAARLDVRFGPTRDEHLDIYPAAGPGPRPVLVFVHGGYWRLMSAKDFALVSIGPLANGVDVVVTNYSLAPKVGIEEITRQSRAALAWVRAHAASWGGDPERLHVAGHSAGGQQVAMLLATPWEREYDLPPDLIKSGTTVSGLFDLRPLPYTFVAPKLQLTQRTIETQSPVLAPVGPGPRRIVTWGGGETGEFIRQSQAYLAHCQACGIDATGLALGHDDHFEAVIELSDPASALTTAVVELIGGR